MTSIDNYILVVVSEWLLTPANFRLYHGKNWIHFDEMIIISVWTKPTGLVDLFHSASILCGKHLQTTSFHHEGEGGAGLRPIKNLVLPRHFYLSDYTKTEIWVLEVSILPLLKILLFDFLIVPTVWYFVFILIL